ncbi:hypothetical protein CKN73_01080 [Carnobacterium divergens]|uniref:hypothetical protein n=1 Tax=Carnobacterium divergens TaxID=2748 RepID=UPI0010719BC9|nr:hypothetical protein [Carnobacterium divergens]TFJ45066.1 hypothetical protein CKN77_01075 [Carnobacterium divergens]TFJ52135.1 hypothetical protein CKN73_01080 [Carnobacterium divergens]TFJ57712.1 hypothetical protein CKN83_01075 [Carnobacterium divergens]TFJ65727.1 hypothetical protein CKN89_01080 [Carnobacterium divergens]TFJ74032.1 hypothetical protein CKN91_01075 [Carnobacterium divergens]
MKKNLFNDEMTESQWNKFMFKLRAQGNYKKTENQLFYNVTKEIGYSRKDTRDMYESNIFMELRNRKNKAPYTNIDYECFMDMLADNTNYASHIRRLILLNAKRDLTTECLNIEYEKRKKTNLEKVSEKKNKGYVSNQFTPKFSYTQLEIDDKATDYPDQDFWLVQYCFISELNNRFIEANEKNKPFLIDFYSGKDKDEICQKHNLNENQYNVRKCRELKLLRALLHK